MTEKIKQAAITCVVVLVGIYILRRVPMVGDLVDTAISG